MSADPLEGSERARQEFEKWIRDRIAGGMHGWDLTRDGDGYHLGVVHSCWIGWQARGRSLEQERDELLNHALQCMDRSCKRCNAAMKERDLVHKGDS